MPVKKRDALLRIDVLLEMLPQLRDEGMDSTNFGTWKRDVETAIRHIFPDSQSHLDDFRGAFNIPTIVTDATPRSFFESQYQKKLGRAENVLKSMRTEVDTYWPEDPSLTEGTEMVSEKSIGRVFIVHGHDGEAKHSMARFVEALGLQVVILEEQPDGGRTIIEKYEEYADVQYVIALVTPDDIGASKERPDELERRARQNVIFELGYFMGKLGRGKVAILKSNNADIPSDLHGIVYIPMSGDFWKLRLAREMKNAGLTVDLNDVT